MEHRTFNRRDALRTIAVAGAGVVSAPLWVEALSALAREQAPHVHASTAAAAAAGPWSPKVFTARQDDTVTTLCELIIPATDTPGAKIAQVNRFIDTVLHEAPPSEKDAFLNGLGWMDTRSTALFGKDVLSATPEQQVAFLTRLSSEDGGSADDKPGAEFFRALKSMTITGYYTTQIGLQQELGDDGKMVLAEFKGCTHPEHQS
jgi:Gluconate 2-dehydrogenase subunit 3